VEDVVIDGVLVEYYQEVSSTLLDGWKYLSRYISYRVATEGSARGL
jgi:hypothetical protein